mgnify:CR=1 FL=1|jgi:hypothetical protein
MGTKKLKRVAGLFKNRKRPGLFKLYRVVSNDHRFTKYMYVCESLITKKFTILCSLGSKKANKSSWCVKDFYFYQNKTK